MEEKPLLPVKYTIDIDGEAFSWSIKFDTATGEYNNEVNSPIFKYNTTDVFVGNIYKKVNSLASKALTVKAESDGFSYEENISALVAPTRIDKLRNAIIIVTNLIRLDLLKKHNKKMFESVVDYVEDRILKLQDRPAWLCEREKQLESDQSYLERKAKDLEDEKERFNDKVNNVDIRKANVDIMYKTLRSIGLLGVIGFAAVFGVMAIRGCNQEVRMMTSKADIIKNESNVLKTKKNGLVYGVLDLIDKKLPSAKPRKD